MSAKTLGYILKRLGLAILTVWVVITATFFIMHAVPGGPFMSEKATTAAVTAQLEAKYGLDKPLMEQYFTYLKDIITKFDFGPSTKQRGRQVTDIIADGLKVSAKLGVIAAATLLIVLNTRTAGVRLGDTVRHAFFQVSSIITTTGFSSCDFDLWPTLSKEILVMLMFVGACAGSTGGGMKVSRILILGKTLKKELKQALHPQVVAPVRMDGKLLNHETIRATNVYVAAYIFIFAASFLLISLDGFDMVTNFTAIAATLNNIGPGLNQVGPMMNFGSYSNPAKLVMIFDMLAGRLEIFPMLVFFLPDTWRRF